jgi:hypothetical protein
MLINQLMEQLNREAHIASSLLAQQGYNVSVDELTSDFSLVYLKAREQYDLEQSNHSAQFKTYLSRCFQYQVSQLRRSIDTDRLTFVEEMPEQPSSDDSAALAMMHEIRAALVDSDRRVFDSMLFDDQPTRANLSINTGFTEIQVYHATNRIRETTKHIMEIES